MKQYRVMVGSKNPVKNQAVKMFCETDLRMIALVTGEYGNIGAKSRVSAQPKSLREMTIGAINRVTDAMVLSMGTYDTIGFGIESGIFTVRQINGKDLIFDTTCCAIAVPGHETMIGYCPAWQLPSDIIESITDGLEMDEAFFHTKRTTNKDLGEAEGAIGLLSEGRLTRLQYTYLAIEAALLSWKGM